MKRSKDPPAENEPADPDCHARDGHNGSKESYLSKERYGVTSHASILMAVLESADRAPDYLREAIELARFAYSVRANADRRDEGRFALTRARKLLFRLQIPDEERARMEQIWHAILPGRVRMFQRTEVLLQGLPSLEHIAIQLRYVREHYSVQLEKEAA